MLVAKVHSKFNLNRSKLWSLNSFYPTRFKQTSVTSGKPECQTRPNVYEFNIASTFYQKEIVILNRRSEWVSEKGLTSHQHKIGYIETR